MFARGTRFQMSPDRIDERVANYRQNTLPTFGQLAGFMGAAVLVDRATGAGQTVTYWDSEAALEASEETAARLRDSAAQAGTQVGETDHLEIVIQERVAPAQAGTFGRINEVTARPEAIDPLIAFIRDATATLRAQHGFRALIMGVNRQTGRVVVSSVWDTAADREASDASMKERRQTAVQVAGAEGVSVQLLEIVVAEVKQTAPV